MRVSIPVSNVSPETCIESWCIDRSLISRNEDLMYRFLTEKDASWEYSEYIVPGIQEKMESVVDVDPCGDPIFGEVDAVVIEMCWTEYFDTFLRSSKASSTFTKSDFSERIDEKYRLLRFQEEVETFPQFDETKTTLTPPRKFEPLGAFTPVTTIPEIMQRAAKYPGRWVPVRLDAPNGNIATKIKKDARASSEYEARSIKLDNGKFRIEARYRKSQTESTYEMYLKIREALNTSAASVLKDNLLEKTAQHIAERMTGK